MLMVALVAIMLLLTLLDAVTRNARLRAFERLHGTQKLTKKRRGEPATTCIVIESIMMAFCATHLPAASESCATCVRNRMQHLPRP